MRPWKTMIAITAFQILTIIQLIIALGTKITPVAVFSMLLLSVIMWVYVIVSRSFGARGFEMELIAFFMSTISMAVTASSAPASAIKQLAAIVIGR